jgi:hypothetical protein
VFLYAMESTVAFPADKKILGSCCGWFFMTFLKFFLKFRKQDPDKEAAVNALSSSEHEVSFLP